MDKTDFRKLLFKVAFCTMACDGRIAEREISEIKLMDRKASFFDDIDLSSELDQLIKEFRDKGIKVIEELFQTLRTNKLTAIQELLVLEVSLRIMNADEVHDENEIKFLHLLRSKLELHDETINERFGRLEVLHTSDYVKNIKTENLKDEFSEEIIVPELKQFEL